MRPSLLLLLALLPPCLLQLAAAEEPQPYMRIQETPEGEIQLQIALRKLEPTKDTDAPPIWLAGVAHLGSQAYYETIQKHLDAQGLVLFEGVGFHPDKATRLKGERGAGSFEKGMAKDSIQKDMAESLGLVFQLGAIDYDRPNFLNSDMSAMEFMAHFQKGGRNSILSGDSDKDREVEQFMATLAGTSLASNILKGVMKLLGHSPKFQGMARIVLIETLGTVGNEISDTESLPEGMRKLMKMILVKRNKIVLGDLRRELSRKELPDTISIFYGAAHMPHLEARITKNFGYKVGSDTWLTCFSVRPDKQGLSKTDIRFVRRLVAIQMKKHLNR